MPPHLFEKSHFGNVLRKRFKNYMRKCLEKCTRKRFEVEIWMSAIISQKIVTRNEFVIFMFKSDFQDSNFHKPIALLSSMQF